MKRFALTLALALCFCAIGSEAHARDLFEEGDFRLELRSAFKSSLLLTFPYYDDAILFPDRPAGAGLFRLRFDLNAQITDHFRAAVAYEHRVRTSSSANTGAGLLPSAAPAAFRLTPLDWNVIDNAPSYVHQHELDRLYVNVHLDFMDLTVGRQAIGFGRGMLFSAVDLFTPFTPNEVDREWRRGVDAVHLTLRIPEISELSADVVAAFGQASEDGLEQWAVVGRLRAVVGEVDGAVLIGHRAGDNFVAGVLSAALGDAEAHGEMALFGTDGAGIDGGWLGTRGVVMKALLGGSYRVDIGDGLNVVLEYHYSGFGVPNVGRSSTILFDPVFQARFLRGDSQLFGRHALALVLSYPIQNDFIGALSYIQSPVDGSGMVSPTFTWNQSDNLTLVLNLLIPWGTGPEMGVPTSEWGNSAFTIFFQARIYD